MHELEFHHVIYAIPETAPYPAAFTPGMGLSRKAWFVVIVWALTVVVIGVTLGYVLSGQPDISSIRSKMTRTAHASVHLRVEYELPEVGLCGGRSSQCGRFRPGSRSAAAQATGQTRATAAISHAAAH